MDWSLSISLYVVNVAYASWLNETSWDVPETSRIEVDICGNPNLLSPGFVLWLILVPAIACTTHLPGSTLFHGHATVYRLSPASSLADCFATLVLVGNALLKGYPWRQSVAGVLLVRQGIGLDKTYWRQQKQRTPGHSAEVDQLSDHAEEDEAPATSAVFQDDSNKEVDERELRYAFTETTRLMSFERMLGTMFVLTTCIKAIIVVTTNSTSPAMKAAVILTLIYACSFFLLELLAWSLAIPSKNYALLDVPLENIHELLIAVDPGDGPFSLKICDPKDAYKILETDIELQTFGSQDGSDDSIPETATPRALPWNPAMAAVAAIFGAVELLFWLALIGSSWGTSTTLFVATAIAALAIGVSMFTTCLLYLRHPSIRASLISNLDLSNQSRYIAIQRPRSAAVRVSLSLLRWLLVNVTCVNVAGVAWLGLILVGTIVLAPRTLSIDDQVEQWKIPSWFAWV
ncbi:hypothetical protein ACJZ2D_010516 [Fusarium nematophilum]